MGKDKGGVPGKAPTKHHGAHRAEDKTEADPTKSFHIPAPERMERGVGDQQAGGRDD